MQAVILAGGQGTRIAELFPDTPKPMIPICGIPILERQIEKLKENNIKTILLLIGYRGDIISHYFGDGSGCSPITGKPFGVSISYYHEEEPLGSAGALIKVKEQLEEEFLLINGDILFDIDFEKFFSFHKNHDGLASIVVHPNDHPFDSQIVVRDKFGKVLDWLPVREGFYPNMVNAGIHLLSSEIIKNINKEGKLNLDKDILMPLCKEGKLYAYHTTEYVKDMGTPKRFKECTKDLLNKIPMKKNLKEKQKAIFLDRDGVINRYVGFLTDINQFELLDGVAGKIKEWNQKGYLVIVITNQPVIARGDITEKELEKIHNKMMTLLGEQGAYVDAIYVCPHHPDKGFDGERPELKISCDCRKPSPGMLIQASHDWNIDLSSSYMIGDSDVDIEAGQRAGCKTIKVGEHLMLKNLNIM